MHESIFPGISSHRYAIIHRKIIKINKVENRFPKPKTDFQINIPSYDSIIYE